MTHEQDEAEITKYEKIARTYYDALAIAQNRGARVRVLETAELKLRLFLSLLPGNVDLNHNAMTESRKVA